MCKEKKDGGEMRERGAPCSEGLGQSPGFLLSSPPCLREPRHPEIYAHIIQYLLYCTVL